MVYEMAVAPRLDTVSGLRQYLAQTTGYDMFAAAPPVDVDHIARLLGISVVESPTFVGANNLPVSPDTVGLITLGPDSRTATVWLNPFQNSFPPRRRFTLAHEIGHYCMHRVEEQLQFVDNMSTMSRSESYWNRHESEANNFAAELLMPTELVYKVGSEIIGTYKAEMGAASMPFDRFTEMMVRRFRVSNVAMGYRLQNLGIGPSPR